MLVAQEAGRRRIAFAEYDMPGELEACGAPGGDKAVRLVPAVEANAKAVVLEQAEDLREGRSEPAVVIVIDDAAPAAVAVAGNVGRVGQHEIHAGGLEAAHQRGAVPKHDAV